MVKNRVIWSSFILFLILISCKNKSENVSSYHNDATEKFDTIGYRFLKKSIMDGNRQVFDNYLNIIRELPIDSSTQDTFEHVLLANLCQATGLYCTVYGPENWQIVSDSPKRDYFHNVVLGKVFKYYKESCLFGQNDFVIRIKNFDRSRIDSVDIRFKDSYKILARNVSLEDVCKYIEE